MTALLALQLADVSAAATLAFGVADLVRTWRRQSTAPRVLTQTVGRRHRAPAVCAGTTRSAPAPDGDAQPCSFEHHQVVRPPTLPCTMGAPQRGQVASACRNGITSPVCTPPFSMAACSDRSSES